MENLKEKALKAWYEEMEDATRHLRGRAISEVMRTLFPSVCTWYGGITTLFGNMHVVESYDKDYLVFKFGGLTFLYIDHVQKDQCRLELMMWDRMGGRRRTQVRIKSLADLGRIIRLHECEEKKIGWSTAPPKFSQRRAEVWIDYGKANREGDR